MSPALPALLMGIARLGYRGEIKERALSSLVDHVEQYGLEEVLLWIQEDSGLLVIPSYQFVAFLSYAAFAKRKPGGRR